MARGSTVEYLLKANAAGFVSGVTQARKDLDKLDADVRKAGSTIATFAGAGMATAAAGILLVTKRAIEAGGKLADLSAKTGVSAAALQKIGHAAKQGGSDLESAAKAMNIFQKNLVAGGTQGSAIFKQLGLSASELRKEMPEQAFLQTAEAIKNLKNPTEQAAAAMQVFGKSGADLLPAIKAGLSEAAAEAERLGFVMSDQTVAAADALGDSIDTLVATWGGLLNQFGATIVESESVHKLISGLTDIFGELSGAAQDNKTAMRDLVDKGVLMVADGLLLMVKAIGFASDAWGTIKILWNSAIHLATDLSIVMAKASKAMPWTSAEAKAMYEQDIKNMEAYKAALSDQSNAENKAIGDRRTLIAGLEKQFEGLRDSVSAAAGKTADFGRGASNAATGVNTLAGAVKTLADRMKEAVAAGNPFRDLFGDTRGASQMGADDLGALPGYSPQTVPTGGPDAGKLPGISWGQSFKVGFHESIKDLPKIIIGAIQGGGDIGRAIGAHMGQSIGGSLAGSVGNTLTKAFGKTIGGALGSAIPVVGTLIGGALGGLVGKLFGGGPSKEEREAARQKAAQERQRIQDAAVAMRERGIEGLATHGPAFFSQRTIANADDAQRQGTLFAAAWGQVVKEKGIVAAAAAFGDAFAKMKADIEAAGIEAPAWMTAISGQMELGQNDAFKALAESAHTAAEFLRAFAESGGVLNADTMRAFEHEARAAFEGGKNIATEMGQGAEEATKAGFAAANPILQELLNQSVVSGQALSGDIQALIDQSGLVPGLAEQQLAELRLIRAAVTGMNWDGGGNGNNGNPPDWVNDLPQAAGGKRIDREDRGPLAGGGFPVVVHPGETIVPDEDAEDFAHSVLGGSSTSGSVSSALSVILAEVKKAAEKPQTFAPTVQIDARGATENTVSLIDRQIRDRLAIERAKNDKRYVRKS